MKTYKCYVYHNKIGNDEYLVSANSIGEAILECRNRLDNETDTPENWEIVEVVPIVG